MPSSVMPAVRGVSLDLWMTLIRSDPRFKPARNAMLRDIFAPEITEDRFSAVLREADKDADIICMGSGRDLGLAERLAMTLDRLDLPVAERMRSEPVGRALDQQARLAREFHPLPLSLAVPEYLRILRREKGVVVVSTSNTGMLPASLMRDLLGLAGFAECFDAQVFSDEVQASGGEPGCKPCQPIFTATFTAMEDIRAGLERKSVVHIGDNYVADHCGAVGFGFQSVHVNASGTPTTADALRALMGG